jgi:acyl-CoA oxidase
VPLSDNVSYLHSQTKAFDTLAGNLARGDTSLLAEMHAITSGLKVVVSSTGVQDLEVARRSMGGHGYSAFAGLGRLYADYLPSVTSATCPTTIPVKC